METSFTLLSESFITQIKQPPFNQSIQVFQLTEREGESFACSSRFVSHAGSDNLRGQAAQELAVTCDQ